MGGGFETAGGVGSALIARWDADAPPGLAPPHPQLQASSPNPFRTQTTISYELKAPARTRIEVFDLNGRRVDLIMDRVQPAGRHQAVWDASRNHAIRSGIYFARLEAGGESQTLRIALIQ